MQRLWKVLSCGIWAAHWDALFTVQTKTLLVLVLMKLWFGCLCFFLTASSAAGFGVGHSLNDSVYLLCNPVSG